MDRAWAVAFLSAGRAVGGDARAGRAAERPGCSPKIVVVRRALTRRTVDPAQALKGRENPMKRPEGPSSSLRDPGNRAVSRRGSVGLGALAGKSR